MTPLVPLETFRQIMQLSPFHFFGLADGSITPVSSSCDDLVHEHAWQGSDMAGRDDIRGALELAEAKLRGYLDYSIAPHFVDEILPVPRYHDRTLNRIGYQSADGRWLDVPLSEKKLINIGLETRTLIGTVTVAGGSLVYSDADGDGINDTFTATIAMSVTDPNQIAVYFASANRLDGEAVSERWRITPVKVRISGGTATIIGRYWTLVRPVLYEGAATAVIDPTVTANFVTSLEIYRYFCDPTGTTQDTAQAKLIWETAPYPFWATTPTDSSRDPAALAYAIARCTARDTQNGIVGVGEAVYDAATGLWSAMNITSARPPDRITVRYQAGAPLQGGQIDPTWATVVCRLAAAELGRRVCECTDVSKELRYWQIDRAFAGSATEERFNLTTEDMLNPFGTRNGHIYAWHEVQRQRIFTGVLA